MRGSVHAAIGASAPIALVLTRHVDPFQGIVMAAVSAGFALLPDLDHPDACASKALGKPVHRVVHSLCKAAVQATATGKDRQSIAWKEVRKRDPYHRTLTHTVAASLAVASAAFLAASAGAVPAAMVAALGVFMLWPLRRGAVGPVVMAALVAAVGAAVLLDPWLLALAVGGGYLSHVVADGCTAAGVPAFWPVPIQKKRWWSIRLLGGLVSSGSAGEKGPAIGVALASNGLLLLLQI